MSQMQIGAHQIDVLRNTVEQINARDGEALLAKVGNHLLSKGEPDFMKGNWCGHPKLIKLIEALPDVFEVYENSSNAKAVRIAQYQGQTLQGQTSNDVDPKQVDMNFDRFVKAYLSESIASEICQELNLSRDMGKYSVFSSVLRYTYHRAVAEGKVLSDHNLRIFHTGWFYNGTDDVYLLWGYDLSGNSKWLFIKRSSRQAREVIRLMRNRCPEKVGFPEIQFDPECSIVPEYGHILDERSVRIPDEIIDMLRCNPMLPVDIQDADKAYIIQVCRDFLKRLLDGCIADTRSRLVNGTDEAVRFWYKGNNKMCWLIPLRLGVTEKVNLALVLEPCTLNEKPVYRAHTVLNLMEAFTNARLLGPVTAEWLRDVLKMSVPEAQFNHIRDNIRIDQYAG